MKELQENEKIVLRTIKNLNERKFQDYFSCYTQDFKLFAESLPRPLIGIEAAHDYLIHGFIGVFPDLQMTLNTMFSSPEGRELAYRFSASGKKTSGFMGLPPTFKPYRFTGTNFLTFRNGLIATSHLTWDNASILEQLGIIPSSFAGKVVVIDPDGNLPKESLQLKELIQQQKTEEANLSSSLISFERFNARDFDNFWIGHSRNYTLFGDNLPHPIVGLAANKEYIFDFIKTFPDLHLHVKEAQASKNSVIVQFTARGNRTNGFLGLKPTQRPFEFNALYINLFRGTERIATVQYMDTAHVLEQIDPRFPEILTMSYGRGSCQS